MKKITAMLVLALCFSVVGHTSAQKLPNRPKSKIGVSVIDSFVNKSFDLYDQIDVIKKAYEIKNDFTPDQIEIVNLVTRNGEDLINQATDIVDVADHMTFLQQAKAALQVGRAVKILNQALLDSGNLLLAMNGGVPSDGSDDMANIIPAPNESPSNDSNTTFSVVDTGVVAGTQVTLIQTDYAKFKTLTDLLNTQGRITEKKMTDGIATFFVAHDLSSYDLADYIVSNSADQGFVIDSVSDDILRVKTSQD